QSAVERELVLRLASLLWRLRRATTMETGLFDIQAEHLRGYRQARQPPLNSREIVHAACGQAALHNYNSLPPHGRLQEIETMFGMKSATEFARCFLRLANLPNFALDRLSRYEMNLWHQAGRILHALDAPDRRKPQERTRHFSL